MLSEIEQTRLAVSRRTTAKKKSRLGQFFTPSRTASFMAGLFPCPAGACRLLDAGAGIGSLSVAFFDRCVTANTALDSFSLTAFEIDESLHSELDRSLSARIVDGRATCQVTGDDFIEASVNAIQFDDASFTHAILNPPYKKISTDSRYRLLLRQVGIETVNLYSAFVALALARCVRGGQVVAIVPRSFCNGPYYKPFRDFVLEHSAIRHIHLFASRSKAFKDDDVLQENVIIRLERGGAPGPVRVSTSTDDTYADLASHDYPFERIVFADDAERFIHVPTSPRQGLMEGSPTVRFSLADLGVQVSTGPVVDFRLQEYLRDMPEPGTAPLLYPIHFDGFNTVWPLPGIRKPNAIVRNDDTEKWFYPNGHYCVVRRFSSKEEERRIVAGVVAPASFADMQVLGFENHLNLFHSNKRGLDEDMARGLAVFLSTTAVDESFRRFNGHTQVNATDLRLMKYPSRAVLLELGRWAKRNERITQAMVDEQFRSLVA